MEIIIIWILIGIVWPAIKKSMEGPKQEQQKTPQKNMRMSDSPSARQAAPAKPSGQKGFFEQLKEELEKIELEERAKEAEKRQQKAQQPKKQQAQPQKPQPSFFEQKKEKERVDKQLRERYQEQLDTRESECREGRPSLISPADRNPDANYSGYSKEVFSFDALEERFPDPASRMVVYSEILGKPKALR